MINTLEGILLDAGKCGTFCLQTCLTHMEANKDNFGFGENIPDPEQIREQHPIEDDSDTLEPFDDAAEHREIDGDNPADVAFWAEQFQVSVTELKAAMVLVGNAVREVKKYLSV
jgi:hypothetical protein